MDVIQSVFSLLARHPWVLILWSICIVTLVVYAIKKGRNG